MYFSICGTWGRNIETAAIGARLFSNYTEVWDKGKEMEHVLRDECHSEVFGSDIKQRHTVEPQIWVQSSRPCEVAVGNADAPIAGFLKVPGQGQNDL